MTTAMEWRSRHAALLDGAREAIRTRGYWSAFVEVPSESKYGEGANARGRAAFEARLGRPFDLSQPATVGAVGGERSPFGLDLGIAYPRADLDGLIAAAAAATKSWSNVDREARVGVVLEMLVRLNAASFELAYATMHTTGQAFYMAFQAGGPHAQERGLEAVAYAYEAMAAVPARAMWEKPQGKNAPLRTDKRFRVVPRGVALAIGCSTFPAWNSYPGIFASLVTGNATIVKPHPSAVLPLAIFVAIGRDVLRQAGCDPNALLLAADSADAPVAKALVARPEIAIVDYTGSTAFGDWIEEHAHGETYTEKGGVNGIAIDSTGDFEGMTRNIAMSVALYSGQMCTAPQNVFIPRDGIMTDLGHRSYDDVVTGITAAIEALVAVPERAVEILGAIASDATLERLDEENRRDGVVLASRSLAHPQFAAARVRTPLVVALDASAIDRYEGEMFGPIAYAVATANTAQSFALLAQTARMHGAISAIVYSTNPQVLEQADAFALEAGVSLAQNLTGPLLVNQSAAFSDYHVTGANAAGNACIADGAFVAKRFRVLETRVPVVAA